MACQTTTNPAQISVESNTILHIMCIAHAAFDQQVVLSFNQNLFPPIGTFSGTGENKPMKLADGQQVLRVCTENNNILFAQFNFSRFAPNDPFRPAVSVCSPVVGGTPPGPVFTYVTSEDLTDNDDNDSSLMVVDLNAAPKK